VLKRRTAFYIYAGNIICWLFGNCWTASLLYKTPFNKSVYGKGDNKEEVYRALHLWVDVKG
jgi:hypothetical protein